jgi:hypothetical protein
MAIRYEYNSTCCSHYYIETRNNNASQIITMCNVCGQGEYVETNRTEFETIPQPIYQALEEQVVLMKDRFISAGFTEEEINLLIQEAQTQE